MEIHSHKVLPKGLDNIEPDNFRDVIGNMTLLNNDNRELPKDIALNNFRMGALANMMNTNLTIREVAKIVGTNFKTLSIAKTVARKLHNSERAFLERYEKLQAKSWGHFCKEFLPRRKTNKKRLRSKIIEEIAYMLNTLRIEGDDPEVREELEGIRDTITRYLPLTESIVDENYTKYYECVCCGAYPPPKEGWDLQVYKEFPYVKYPRCPDCQREKRQPIKDKLIALYAGYSINQEAYYGDQGFKLL